MPLQDSNRGTHYSAVSKGKIVHFVMSHETFVEVFKTLGDIQKMKGNTYSAHSSDQLNK